MKKRLGVICLFICLLLTGCVSVSVQKADATQTPQPAQTVVTEETSEQTDTWETVSREPVTLRVYSQLCSYLGEQQGWFAGVLLDEFNVKLYYVNEIDEDNPWETADIIVFGNSNQYLEAVEKGRLLSWEADGLLKEQGAYILEHMSSALEYNRSLTSKGEIFGMGMQMVPDTDVCEDFFLTWDIRWDLYKELGYPQVTDLEDFIGLLEDMKEICPTGENGEEVYAMSLWPDWDGSMMMAAKCMATAYYGYDEHHMGLYDTGTGTFYGALEEDGPYLEMLRFFNALYRKGLLDPDSRTQTYEDAVEKLEDGRVLFSVFDYAGSVVYNTEEHLAENKYMASLVPAGASPAAYGLSVYGNKNRIWAIGANTEHARLCMEVINWLSTPEGRLICEYGPKSVTWDYDTEGYTYLTELGKACMADRTTVLTGEYEGCFSDGCPQINAVTWHFKSPNPEANGENYDYRSWKSNLPQAFCEMEQDWRSVTGAVSANEYIKSQNYVVIPEVYYEATAKGSELQSIWEAVSECIVAGSWEAVYAESEEAFEQIVSQMRTDAIECGYERCISWSEYEAARRNELEEEVRKY